MLRLSPFFIAASTLSAPARARVGITMPDPRLRERAAEELALAIVERLESPPADHDRCQMALPL